MFNHVLISASTFYSLYLPGLLKQDSPHAMCGKSMLLPHPAPRHHYPRWPAPHPSPGRYSTRSSHPAPWHRSPLSQWCGSTPWSLVLSRSSLSRLRSWLTGRGSTLYKTPHSKVRNNLDGIPTFVIIMIIMVASYIAHISVTS